MSLLPQRLAWRVARIEPYGFLILILLLFTGVLGYVLWPAIGVLLALVAGMFGLAVSDLIKLASII